MDITDLTPAWFSDVLNADVIEVMAAPIGVGLVGLNVRCQLVGTGAPPSVVVKLPSADPTSRATGVALRNYEREVKFYDQIASTVDIRVPRCHHSSWDAATGDFVLVLEDAAPCRPGDQIAGCTPAQADVALVQLARLHAPRWGDATLDEIDWLTRRDGPSIEFIAGLYRSFWPSFLERFGDSISLSQRMIGERLGDALPIWMTASQLPATVTHGDYRLDNLLFADDVDRDAVGDTVIAVDWQTPGHGSALGDAAYFLGAGLLPELRRQHEEELVRGYHAELVAGGVEVDWATCWHEYRLGSFGGVVMSVIAPMLVERTDRGDLMFRAMGSRHLQHAEDLDAVELLNG